MVVCVLLLGAVAFPVDLGEVQLLDVTRAWIHIDGGKNRAISSTICAPS